MHEDELRRQIVALVTAGADLAAPPAAAAVRRRGRVRRARLASGAVLLVAAVAVGLVAVTQGRLGDQATPAPPVTQPPGPGSAFVEDVRGDYPHLNGLQVVELGGGRLNGFEWHLAAVRGTTRTGGQARVCLVLQREAPNQGGISRDCADQSARRSAKLVIASGGTAQLPLAWGMVPEATARVRIEQPGRRPVVVDAIHAGPGFGQRFFLARWAEGPGKPATVVALDGRGQVLARARFGMGGVR